MIRNRVYGQQATETKRRPIGTDGESLELTPTLWSGLAESSAKPPSDWQIVWTGVGCSLVFAAGAFAAGVLFGLVLGGAVRG